MTQNELIGFDTADKNRIYDLDPASPQLKSQAIMYFLFSRKEDIYKSISQCGKRNSQCEECNSLKEEIRKINRLLGVRPQ
jgi:hypothetical protein